MDKDKAFDFFSRNFVPLLVLVGGGLIVAGVMKALTSAREMLGEMWDPWRALAAKVGVDNPMTISWREKWPKMSQTEADSLAARGVLPLRGKQVYLIAHDLSQAKKWLYSRSRDVRRQQLRSVLTVLLNEFDVAIVARAEQILLLESAGLTSLQYVLCMSPALEPAKLVPGYGWKERTWWKGRGSDYPLGYIIYPKASDGQPHKYLVFSSLIHSMRYLCAYLKDYGIDAGTMRFGGGISDTLARQNYLAAVKKWRHDLTDLAVKFGERGGAVAEF